MDGTVIDVEPSNGNRRAIELRKRQLTESAERWRERIKADPDLKWLGRMDRLQRDCPAKAVDCRPRAVDISKGLDRFYSSSPSTSPPIKVLQIDEREFEGIATSTSRFRFFSHVRRKFPRVLNCARSNDDIRST
ncbi:unnamed protein product [Gongylonema pulchrum]|uniref:Transposase n=1 Tax=Gongylonema pulchrum TaxID=637853 RepID=A0A183D9M5_9BILA|nr:unnamed protein product [Gongylonema pulchrum]